MEFQSWKVNFETEVCSKTSTSSSHNTADQKKLREQKSIDGLVTSQSITGRKDFSDYDMLEAMTASALKRLLDKHIHLRKRVSVEEQRAQQYDRFSRGRQIAHRIFEHFRTIGAFEAVQGVSDQFRKRSQDDDVQDFDTRWDQALSAASETPTETVVEGLYKSKLKDSVRRQTELAMYEQENVRSNEPPNFSRLKTIGRRHVDETMRTRNFR